jgi:hypothetical protein
MSLHAGDYRPRYTEDTVLYRVIDEHLGAFLDTARRHADGASLPAFVEQEFRDFLTCCVLAHGFAHGFARLRCTECALERLLPFSCKGRGFCPACGGAAHGRGRGPAGRWVLPRMPVRRWVLSLPHRLLFEPLTLLEKLPALIPRPRINLVLYHGVPAPNCGWRGPGRGLRRAAGGRRPRLWAERHVEILRATGRGRR